MRVGKFTLTGGLEGKTVVLNDRQFKDGVLTVTENDARLLEPVYTRYYEAKLEYVVLEEAVEVKPADASASLAKTATQAAAK